jgi:DNA repair protein RadC
VYVRELRVRFRNRWVAGPALAGSLKTPTEAASVLAQILGHEVIEVCGLLCLSTRSELIAYHELSRGTLDSTIVHPRDVFRTALLANAATVVVGHNHPSGIVQPSPDDLVLTRRLSVAAAVVGIDLADHLIVSASSEFFSFRDAALL